MWSNFNNKSIFQLYFQSFPIKVKLQHQMNTDQKHTKKTPNWIKGNMSPKKSLCPPIKKNLKCSNFRVTTKTVGNLFWAMNMMGKMSEKWDGVVRLGAPCCWPLQQLERSCHWRIKGISTVVRSFYIASLWFRFSSCSFENDSAMRSR